MIFLWFIVGLALGGGYVWLHWVQVKNIIPNENVPRRNSILLYTIRLILFTLVTAISMRAGVMFGLVMFAGFWAARSLLLVLIGSGRIKLTGRIGS